MIFHPHLNQHLRAVAFRATRPADFEDTGMVCQDGTPEPEFVFDSGYNEFKREAVFTMVCAMVLVVGAALIADVTAIDVLSWLAESADALMRGISGVSLALAPMAVRTDLHRVDAAPQCYSAAGEPLHELGHRVVPFVLAAAAGLVVGLMIGGAL